VCIAVSASGASANLRFAQSNGIASATALRLHSKRNR